MSDDLDVFLEDAATGRYSRQELLRRAAALGLAAPAVTALVNAGSALASGRALTPTFYSWIYDLHTVIPSQVNKDYSKKHKLSAKIAPVQGFGIERFVAEAKDKNSSWDVYVGMTPFVEMASLIDAGVIEPWDKYIQPAVKADIIPSILKEATYQGHIWAWPFLLDIIVQSWNAEIVKKAGLDPEKPPKTWDQYLANARQVVKSKAAPFGATFDAHGWRSLAPITHTISTNVYTSDGLFNFTHPAAVQALEIMKQMIEVANPNVLQPGTTDGGVNNTPDEQAFAARQVAYYIKYQNAPIRFGNTWPDPKQLRIAGLPKTPGGAGATVFWNTGAALFKYGQNKAQAADYMRFLTYDERVWKQSIGGGRAASGQLAPYTSLWNKWTAHRPSWMPAWAPLVFSQLKVSKAIKTDKFGLQQFVIGQPYWQKYLTGDEKDPKKAMAAALAAVRAAKKKS